MNPTSGYIRQPWPKSRQTPRLPVEGRLTIDAASGKIRGWLHDISEDGVGGVVSAQLEIDTPVDIEFELSADQPPIRTSAVVRFASGFRYGLQFTGLTPEQVTAIHQYCATASRNVPPPAPPNA